MDFEQIKPTLISYVKRLKQHIVVQEALVFGSVAQGTANPDSDVDLVILSRDFQLLDSDDREKLLYKATLGIKFDLHVIGITPEEYETASSLTSLGRIKTQQTIKIA